MNSRTSVFFLSLCPFSAQPAPVSSWTVSCAVTVTNHSCAGHFPFGRYSCLFTSWPVPALPVPPFLCTKTSASLQEPSGESSPALADCQRWSAVYMSTSLVWPPYGFLGLGSHNIQIPRQLLNRCLYVNVSWTFDQRKTFLKTGCIQKTK